MIIVLKEADFSSDNIGQIEISRDLNPYTVAAIEASGNNSLTDLQKFALDDLFIALEVDNPTTGIISKIRKMYIPMIASSVGNALINYASNDFTADATPLATDWELRNHGIAVSPQTTGSQTFTLTLDNPLLASNFMQVWLRTENMVPGTNDSCSNLRLRGKTNTSKWLGIWEHSASSNNSIELSASNAGYTFGTGIVSSKSDEQRTASGILVSGSSSAHVKKYLSSYLDVSLSSLDDMSGESKQTLFVLGIGTQQAPKPYGFMMIGEAIAQADFENIISKVNALYEAIKE